MRKSGINLQGYPNHIAPYNVAKLSKRHHPLGNFPIYPLENEPDQFFEEFLAQERYKDLVNEWCRIFNQPVGNVVAPGMDINMLLGNLYGQMLNKEYGKYRELEAIAEQTVRDFYHLGEDEVIFDLEILDASQGEKPADSFKTNKGEEMFVNDPSYTEDVSDEIMRRRLTNALQQGAALKGHYLFHAAHNKLEQLLPGVSTLYNKAMITNDLMYYYIDDVMAGQMTESESQAGMVQVDFSGEIPVIRVKAVCFTVLVHEIVKGVMEVLTSVGIPKDPNKAKLVLDLCDTVLNEFWDIRLGPKLYEMLHSLIDVNDYDILKHIVIGISQLNTEEFLGFMQALFSNDPAAKETIDIIRKTKRTQIANYIIRNNTSQNSEEIDWDAQF